MRHRIDKVVCFLDDISWREKEEEICIELTFTLTHTVPP